MLKCSSLNLSVFSARYWHLRSPSLVCLSFQHSLAEAVRWLCMILCLGRILITQNNEEIMLTRIVQLGICKKHPSNIITTLSHSENKQDESEERGSGYGPAEFYAAFFFHAALVACEELRRYHNSTICDKGCLVTLETFTSKLLVMFASIFSSGMYSEKKQCFAFHFQASI